MNKQQQILARQIDKIVSRTSQRPARTEGNLIFIDYVVEEEGKSIIFTVTLNTGDSIDDCAKRYLYSLSPKEVNTIFIRLRDTYFQIIGPWKPVGPGAAKFKQHYRSKRRSNNLYDDVYLSSLTWEASYEQPATPNLFAVVKLTYTEV